MEAKLKEAKESGNEAEYQAARKLNAMMSAFSSIDDYYTSTSMIENVERYEEIYEGRKMLHTRIELLVGTCFYIS